MVSRSVACSSLAILALVSCARGGFMLTKDIRPGADQRIVADGAVDTTPDTDAAGPDDLARDGDLLAGPPLVVTRPTGVVEVSVAVPLASEQLAGGAEPEPVRGSWRGTSGRRWSSRSS